LATLGRAKLGVVDPLCADDLERARTTPPAEKLLQALDMMRTGFALKRASLRARHPHASDEELATMFAKWLAHDE
jgi:Rv0078B-related antitoxin